MNKTWLSQFFISHYGVVVALAFRFSPRSDLVKDIVQQVYLELFNEEKTFPNETELKLHIRKLTRRVAQRYWNEHYRKQGAVQLELARHLAVILEANDASHDVEFETVALRQCLSKLPGKSRTVIEDYYFNDCSVPLIAGRIGMSVDAVYKAIARVREKLGECIRMLVKREGKEDV